MKFLDRWKMLMYNTIKRIDPEVDSELLEEILDKYITKDVKNPRTTLDNNYIKRRKDVSFLSILDWVGDKKPIIAGNGTFYKNQHEALNPRATMLNDKPRTRFQDSEEANHTHYHLLEKCYWCRLSHFEDY